MSWGSGDRRSTSAEMMCYEGGRAGEGTESGGGRQAAQVVLEDLSEKVRFELRMETD